MEFIEAPAFTRRICGYLSDDGYRELQKRLAANPELGDLMPGTGGLRKVRWTDPTRGKGRRGGLRIIYYYFLADRQIWLMTPKEKKALKSAIENEALARRLAAKGKTRRTRS